MKHDYMIEKKRIRARIYHDEEKQVFVFRSACFVGIEVVKKVQNVVPNRLRRFGIFKTSNQIVNERHNIALYKEDFCEAIFDEQPCADVRRHYYVRFEHKKDCSLKMLISNLFHSNMSGFIEVTLKMNRTDLENLVLSMDKRVEDHSCNIEKFESLHPTRISK